MKKLYIRNQSEEMTLKELFEQFLVAKQCMAFWTFSGSFSYCFKRIAYVSISIITISFRWIGFIFKSIRLCAKPFLKSPTLFETPSIIEGEHFPYSLSMKGLIISIPEKRGGRITIMPATRFLPSYAGGFSVCGIEKRREFRYNE